MGSRLMSVCCIPFLLWRMRCWIWAYDANMPVSKLLLLQMTVPVSLNGFMMRMDVRPYWRLGIAVRMKPCALTSVSPVHMTRDVVLFSAKTGMTTWKDANSNFVPTEPRDVSLRELFQPGRTISKFVHSMSFVRSLKRQSKRWAIWRRN